MALSFPTYELFDSTGVSSVYKFPNVIDDPGVFSDPKSFVEHTSLRGEGSIISAGCGEPFDITLTFVLQGTDYEDLVAQMDALLTTIDFNTKYVLKIDLTTGGSTRDYKVKRLSSFQFPLDRQKKRVTFQTVRVTFRVDSWA